MGEVVDAIMELYQRRILDSEDFVPITIHLIVKFPGKSISNEVDILAINMSYSNLMWRYKGYIVYQ